MNFTCAGGSELRLKGMGDKKFYEAPIEVLDFGIDLNLKGAMYYHHALLPHMIKQEAALLSLSALSPVRKALLRLLRFLKKNNSPLTKNIKEKKL